MNSFKSAPYKQVCNKEVFYLTDTDVSKRSQCVSTNPLYKVKELKINPYNREVLKNLGRKKKITFSVLPYLIPMLSLSTVQNRRLAKNRFLYKTRH